MWFLGVHVRCVDGMVTVSRESGRVPLTESPQARLLYLYALLERHRNMKTKFAGRVGQKTNAAVYATAPEIALHLTCSEWRRAIGAAGLTANCRH